jgi:hypothetical protein
MNDFIFSSKNKKEDIIEYSYYCLVGDEDFIDDDGNPRLEKDGPKVLAKQTKKNNYTSFAIKIANNNKLYNPLDYGIEDKSYSIVDNVCRPQDKFKTVNQNTFDLYVNFLSSKNISWLTQAERNTI